MKILWISTPTFTCKFKVDSNYKIIETAPILKKFNGQKIENLIKWVDKISRGQYTLIQMGCLASCHTCTFPYCKREKNEVGNLEQKS